MKIPAQKFLQLITPKRLELLLLIGARGKMCVKEIETALGRRQAAISRDVSELSKAKIVLKVREGRKIYIVLNCKSIEVSLDG
jgi:DNA-binding transcriptional ArsR family regulator